MSQGRLEQLRSELDSVNLQLLELLSERHELPRRSVRRSKSREFLILIRYARKMLDTLVEHNQGPFDNETVRHLFKQIFQASLKLRKSITRSICW